MDTQSLFIQYYIRSLEGICPKHINLTPKHVLVLKSDQKR